MHVGALLASFVGALTGPPATTDEKKGHHAAEGGKHAGLEKFKLLAGEWVEKASSGG